MADLKQRVRWTALVIPEEADGTDGEYRRTGCSASKCRFTFVLLFTTGTTGSSKGVVMHHKNDVAIAGNVMKGTQMKPGMWRSYRCHSIIPLV